MLEFHMRRTEVLENYHGKHLLSACLPHKPWVSWGWKSFLIQTKRYFVFSIKSRTDPDHGRPGIHTGQGMHACQKTFSSRGLLVNFSQVKWIFLDVLFPMIMSTIKLESCEKEVQKGWGKRKPKKLKITFLASGGGWRDQGGEPGWPGSL